MSIVLAFVHDKYAVVASDGRKTSPAYFENGGLRIKGAIENDNCDKTFELDQGTIVGVSAGLTEFDDKTIETHLREIIETDCTEGDEMEKVLNTVKDRMRERLESNKKIIINERKLDLILIASLSENPKDVNSYCYRFKGNESQIIVCDESTEKIRNKVKWVFLRRRSKPRIS